MLSISIAWPFAALRLYPSLFIGVAFTPRLTISRSDTGVTNVAIAPVSHKNRVPASSGRPFNSTNVLSDSTGHPSRSFSLSCTTEPLGIGLARLRRSLTSRVPFPSSLSRLWSSTSTGHPSRFTPARMWGGTVV